MDHVNNIPTGLLVPAQVPLDAKRVVLNNTILQDLGANDNLAFTYEDGLIVFSVAPRQRWEWRQRRTPVEGDTSLLTTDFVYPDGHVIAGIDYSLKAFNFFLKREAFLLSNVGTGKQVYKGFNVVNEKHEFYTLETDGKITLSYPEVEGQQTGVLLFTFPNFVNLSDKTKIFKGYNPTGNQFEFYTLDSTDIKIDQNVTTGVVNLSLPQSSSVPSIYISQDYIPSYDDWYKANALANSGVPVAGFLYRGEGTLAKPFTNTTTYTLVPPGTTPGSHIIAVANSAIQNGLDYYEGPNPTFSRLNPEKEGQKIQILSSNGYYIFAGDFNYTGLNLEIYSTVSCTNTNKLLDLNSASFESDLVSPTKDVVVTINLIGENTDLIVAGTGFFNSGNNISGNTYAYRKQVELFGTGRIFSVSSTVGNYIINAGTEEPTFNNAGHGTFNIKVDITCIKQGVILNSGKSRIEATDIQITSGSIIDTPSAVLEAIKITGGRVLITGGTITLFDGAGSLTRLRGIVFDSPEFALGSEASLNMRNVTLAGKVITLFDRKNKAGNINITGCTSLYFESTHLFGSSGNIKVWGKEDRSTEGTVIFISNVIENTTVDFTKVDFTTDNQNSVSNIIGKDVILSLKIFGSKADAITAGVPLGGTFIQRSVITDGANLSRFKVNDTFYIASQSSTPTNFDTISIGTTSNDVGTYISYLGSGTVTIASGASLYYDEICTVS